jgi:N6-adenosine-specific RNA methylase IME4
MQLPFACGPFSTILADPPWQFENRTGKVAPEHRRLSRYRTMALSDICALPVEKLVADTCHLYLWVPNALLPSGLDVLRAWDLTTNQISFSIKLGKTVHQMDAVWGTTSATLRRYYCLGCEAKVRALYLRRVPKLTYWRHESANTRRNRRSSIN